MSTIANPATSVEHYKMLIDGELVSSRTTFPVLNPATEEVISEVPAGTPGTPGSPGTPGPTASEGVAA